jgi:beta-glucanase (GH16 family)
MKRFSIIPLLLLALTACGQQKSDLPKGYTKLVWADEFNGSGLPDKRNWTYEDGYQRNHELQFYTRNRIDNAQQKDGHLVITARNDSMKYDGKTFPITSASLITRGLHEWTYGRIEIRAKIPSSLGTWPALWTLGANINTVNWPLSGEIDIMEHVGYMPDTLHFNVHTKKYNHAASGGKGTRIYYPAPEKAFHIYVIEWRPERIDWFFDGTKVFTYQNEKTGEDAWPFDKPQYLLLNLAFGGDWGGRKGIDLKSLPQSMLVDYVRVYQ